MRGVVVIGPIGAGKTTVAGLLGQRLGKRVIDLDFVASQMKADYFIGATEANRLQGEFGVMAWYKYQKPFEFLVATRTVTAHQDAVISFGGGHSVYDDAVTRGVLKSVLREHHVVLLLESENRGETLYACQVRKKGQLPHLLNEYFVDHVSNRELATLVTYVMGRNPEAVCEEIIANLQRVDSQQIAASNS